MRNYAYELTDDGYYIFINGNKMIHQYGDYIPDKNKSLEENALEQIEELKKADNKINDDEERITNIELALAEIYESMVS